MYKWVFFITFTLPNPFFVEVPQVDVVGDELPEDDGEVVPKPTIDQEEPRADDAEHPIEYGRLHLATLLGDNPLHKYSRRETPLRQQTNGSNHQSTQLHRLVV